MTRKECEQRIIEKLREIWQIANEYNPNANRCGLNMYILENRYHAFRIVEHASPDDPEPPVNDIDFYGTFDDLGEDAE